jgi:hypothetical protein
MVTEKSGLRSIDRSWRCSLLARYRHDGAGHTERKVSDPHALKAVCQPSEVRVAEIEHGKTCQIVGRRLFLFFSKGSVMLT